MPYPTRPLESKRKAKELRQQHYRDIWNARAEGKLLISGGMRIPFELAAGFGDFEVLNEHFSITMATHPTLAEKASEAFESLGFARDFCALSRLYLGAMFLGETPFGTFPRPDYCFMFHACDIQAKWFQVVAEHYGIPFFCLEQPLNYPPHPRKHQKNVEYLAQQFEDFIAWGEKNLHRPFDDQRLAETLRPALECQSLWAEVCTLNRANPAPLEDRSLYALEAVGCIMRHKPQAAEFMRFLRDEVKEHVRDGMAALPTQRFRLMHDNQPPYYYLNLYQDAERYGAVCIGSHTSFYLLGAFEDGPDGRLAGRTMPWEKAPLKDRQDILMAMARWYADTPFYEDILVPQLRMEHTLRLVEEWKVDGVLFHLNRGCEGVTAGALEIRQVLRERGIPTAVYEANYCDRRDFSQSQVVDTLESFLESQGLTKLAA